MTRTLSSRDFNQNLGSAKKAAEREPVVITDRGQPTHVLLSHAEWRRLSGKGQRSLLSVLRQSHGTDVDFDPPRLADGITRSVDLND